MTVGVWKFLHSSQDHCYHPQPFCVPLCDTKLSPSGDEKLWTRSRETLRNKLYCIFQKYACEWGGCMYCILIKPTKTYSSLNVD